MHQMLLTVSNIQTSTFSRAHSHKHIGKTTCQACHIRACSCICVCVCMFKCILVHYVYLCLNCPLKGSVSNAYLTYIHDVYKHACKCMYAFRHIYIELNVTSSPFVEKKHFKNQCMFCFVVF